MEEGHLLTATLGEVIPQASQLQTHFEVCQNGCGMTVQHGHVAVGLDLCQADPSLESLVHAALAIELVGAVGRKPSSRDRVESELAPAVVAQAPDPILDGLHPDDRTLRGDLRCETTFIVARDVGHAGIDWEGDLPGSTAGPSHFYVDAEQPLFDHHRPGGARRFDRAEAELIDHSGEVVAYLVDAVGIRITVGDVSILGAGDLQVRSLTRS
mmetsp:Transcript_40871/g.94873  ORF Transcript_40871/g.94873 Transcript_40871/m.94873 type:complete len:212 (+) Transcript_40871:3550-4185(+)